MEKSDIIVFERLNRWFREYPDKPAVIDEFGVMSFAELDRQSACIYHWLKLHGYGKEDFIMIHLPRSAKIVAAVHGIYKAGAAFVICQTDFPRGRYDYVYRDCGCRLELTQELYDEMLECSPIPGREAVDLHDACFALYTSGSSGAPKGALLEYGNLDQTWKGAHCDGEPFARPGDICGMIPACNFATFNLASTYSLSNGAALYIVPTEIVKNTARLCEQYEKVGVTVSSFAPSFLRMIPHLNSQFRKAIIGGEMSNGIYSDDYTIINIHAMSETCFHTACFHLDRPYDLPPVGKPQFDNRFFLVDGEICFENRYFRGYINRPDLTAECFKDGIFHSGDMGVQLADGSIAVTGRKDSMMKIAGNKVIPAEVEMLLKRTLGITAVVKGYLSGERAYLCAYYIGETELDPAYARNRLSEFTPAYMIPTYFIHMDEFPRLPSGKLELRAFREPDINDFRRDYVAPETENEKLICSVFEKVLKLDCVGVTEDFFELGGDSLRAIEAVVAIDRPGITSVRFYELRCPKKLARLLDDRITPLCELSELSTVPAEEYAAYFLDYQVDNPKSTLFNENRLIRIEADSNGRNLGEIAERLAAALNTVRKNSPMLHSVYTKKNGMWYITPAIEKTPRARVEHISNKELELSLADIIRPFVPTEEICRFRILLTEDSLYFFYDFHHSAIDGSAIKIFRKALGKAYRGIQPDADFYLKCRNALELQRQSAEYIEDKTYLNERFSGPEWLGIPTPDRCESGAFCSFIRRLPKSALLDNANMLASVLRALTEYNNNEYAVVTWTYHCRDTKEKQNSIGLFIRDIPAGVHITRGTSHEAILKAVREEIENGIRHMRYQWALAETRQIVYTVMQSGIYNYEGIDGLISSPAELPSKTDPPSDNPMDIQFIDCDGKKYIKFGYDSGMYDCSSAEHFADLITEWFNTDHLEE